MNSTPETVTIKRKSPAVIADRDKVFAPLERWPRFKRLHAFSIDHATACPGPKDSQDAQFNVWQIPAASWSRGTTSELARARVLLPEATISVRDHSAECPHCSARVVRRSLLVAVPVEGGTKASREFAL